MCVVVYILCAVIVILIHCRRGSVCLRVCLVILMCYISLSAVVYERFRRAKQYLKQHYLNIKILIYLCTRESFEITADLPSVQPALILSVSHTANQESTWRQITNDGLVCFWLHLLLSCVFGFLHSCVHNLVSLMVQFCKHTQMLISFCLLCVLNFPKVGFLKYALYICLCIS